MADEEAPQSLTECYNQCDVCRGTGVSKEKSDAEPTGVNAERGLHLSVRLFDLMASQFEKSTDRFPDGWRSFSLSELMLDLGIHYGKFCGKILIGAPIEKVWKDAADIANYLVMIADKLESRK